MPTQGQKPDEMPKEPIIPEPKKAPSLNEQTAAMLKQFDAVNDNAKTRIAREMKKYRSGEKSKMFRWNFDNVTGSFLRAIDKKTAEAKNQAQRISEKEPNPHIIMELKDLKNNMEASLNTDMENIIALLNRIKGEEFYITKEGLANLELYVSTIKFMMESPSMKPLVDIFKEVIFIQKLDDKTYKVLEESMLSLNKDMVVLVSTILRLAKGSIREEFTKRFIDEHPENAFKALVFANFYGTYTAFEMKKYFEYAATTYEKKPEARYQEARKEFLIRIDKFEEESKTYQTCYMIQEQIKDRVRGLGREVYGEDASSRLSPGAILKFAGRIAAWTSLGGNLLANRPMLMETYEKQGVLAAISSYATMPYVAGSGALLFGLHTMDSNGRLEDVLIGSKEKQARENAQGLKRFNDLVHMHSTWGMFLENDGAEILGAYAKKIETAEGNEKEPTIKDFKEFLAEREKNTEPSTRPSRFLGKVLSGEFEKDETDNLKMYLRAMEAQKIQNQKQFNKKLDEARQNI